MVTEVLVEADGRMRKAVEALQKTLSTIRTGRANPGLVEHLRVEYYGVPTPLNQIASIATPEPRLLVIQPWDKRALGAIEKAILKSDLGLNPTNDGNIIRLPIPHLTEERRKELIRLVGKRVEDGRVALRNIRRDALEQLREKQKNKEISEDEQKRAAEQLQKLIDRYIAEAEEINKAKETELWEV